MNFGGTRRRAPALVDLTALIDVVFLLLLFFVVTATFDATRSLEVTLPDSSRASSLPAQAKARVLLLQADGSLSLDGRKTELAALPDALGEGALIRLEADEAVAHGQVVRVMDALKPLKPEALRIAVKEAKP